MISLWNRIELFVIGVQGALALLLALYVMATRYLIPEWSIDWGEELIVYLLVWAIWLSSSRLAGKNEHIQTDLIIKIVPPGIQYWLSFIHYLIGIIFTFAMLLAGSQVVWFAITIGENTESSMHFPLWVYYLSIPFGLGLMTLRYCHQLMHLFTKTKG